MQAYGIFAGLTATSIWGGMYVVSKVDHDVLPPFMLVCLQLILGIECLTLITAF
ncbi:MAG TPA: hypothetical protein G4O14_11195 [Anaerolineae bacterium]|nr:hypothetical protein [Anaerolineae bacterium]